MARGIANHLLEHPERAVCWCGKEFVKRAKNQLHCSRQHRNAAAVLRRYLPRIPYPAQPVVQAQTGAQPPGARLPRAQPPDPDALGAGAGTTGGATGRATAG